MNNLWDCACNNCGTGPTGKEQTMSNHTNTHLTPAITNVVLGGEIAVVSRSTTPTEEEAEEEEGIMALARHITSVEGEDDEEVERQASRLAATIPGATAHGTQWGAPPVIPALVRVKTSTSKIGRQAMKEE